jgi:hypothetical protein
LRCAFGCGAVGVGVWCVSSGTPAVNMHCSSAQSQCLEFCACTATACRLITYLISLIFVCSYVIA